MDCCVDGIVCPFRIDRMARKGAFNARDCRRFSAETNALLFLPHSWMVWSGN
jgi:hypothetical protein